MQRKSSVAAPLGMKNKSLLWKQLGEYECASA